MGDGRHHGRVKGDGIKGLPGLDLPSPGTCTPIRISFMPSPLLLPLEERETIVELYPPYL